MVLSEVCSQWRQHSQLLTDSDFSVVEPILTVRSVAQHTLLSRLENPDNIAYLSSVLTDHLMELCRLARKAGNTQVASTCAHALSDLRQGVLYVVVEHCSAVSTKYLKVL